MCVYTVDKYVLHTASLVRLNATAIALFLQNKGSIWWFKTFWKALHILKLIIFAIIVKKRDYKRAKRVHFKIMGIDAAIFLLFLSREAN